MYIRHFLKRKHSPPRLPFSTQSSASDGTMSFIGTNVSATSTPNNITVSSTSARNVNKLVGRKSNDKRLFDDDWEHQMSLKIAPTPIKILVNLIILYNNELISKSKNIQWRKFNEFSENV